MRLCHGDVKLGVLLRDTVAKSSISGIISCRDIIRPTLEGRQTRKERLMCAMLPDDDVSREFMGMR